MGLRLDSRSISGQACRARQVGIIFFECSVPINKSSLNFSFTCAQQKFKLSPIILQHDIFNKCYVVVFKSVCYMLWRDYVNIPLRANILFKYGILLIIGVFFIIADKEEVKSNSNPALSAIFL